MQQIEQVYRMDRDTGTIDVVPPDVAFQALGGTYYIPLRALLQAEAGQRPAWTPHAGYSLSPFHFPMTAPGGMVKTPSPTESGKGRKRAFAPRKFNGRKAAPR